MLEGKCGKMEFQKCWAHTTERIKVSKSKATVLEKKHKRKMKKKNEMKWKEKRVEMKRNKVELVLHAVKNDPWSDHPETQFGPIYPFF